MKHRFFLRELPPSGAVATVDGNEFHHGIRVRRIAVGEEIEIFDGQGRAMAARVVAVGSNSFAAEIFGAAPAREASRPIRLALGLIHLDRFELALQKATELGVARFTPITTQRSEVAPERLVGKRSRWEKIILEAVKQSGRATLPIIDEATPFENVLGEAGSALLFDESGSPESLLSPGDSGVTIFIGPEGGWTDEEIEAARIAGCRVVRVGPRRLRAETAAIAAVTLVASSLGDLT